MKIWHEIPEDKILVEAQFSNICISEMTLSDFKQGP